MCFAVFAQTSDITELLSDYQIDLLRALEMSRLQFLRDIGSLRPGTSDRQDSTVYHSYAAISLGAMYISSGTGLISLLKVLILLLFFLFLLGWPMYKKPKTLSFWIVSGWNLAWLFWITYTLINGVGFLVWCHTVKMIPFQAEKCCHLVSDCKASAQRLYSSICYYYASSWSMLHLYLFCYQWCYFTRAHKLWLWAESWWWCQCQMSMSMSKTFIGGAGAICREFESESPATEEMLDWVVCSSEQFCFQMCLECGDGGGTFSRWRHVDMCPIY